MRTPLQLLLAVPLATLAACAEKPAEPPAVAAACLECHRGEAAAAIPGWPPLDSLSSEEIAAKLRGYRERQVPESRMSDVAHELSDEEIRQLAEYYGRGAGK
jgi:cytochrome c553